MGPKKSIEERQNVVRNERHTGEPRKVRSSPRAPPANEQRVRTTSHQNFVPSPLAVPPRTTIYPLPQL
uniref:Uncharacterized protein n=1 Tax=Ditylenchus dipsaci TaxID=166011 RepID=A0A915EE62_9BILA